MKVLLWRMHCSALYALFVFASVGCGGTANSPGNNDEDEPAAVKKVSAAKLPPLDDYLPPLDEGRLEIAPPQGWKTMSREAKYVARFVQGDPLALPRILISVDPSDIDGRETADEENVTKFAEQTAASLKQRNAAVLEAPRPMLIGKRAFARYVLKSKYRDAVIERQMLQTVVDGRLYTIDLQVDNGELLKYRDQAYAVAAGLKFLQAGGPTAPPSAPADELEKPADR